MIPILTTTTALGRPQPEALEHGTFLLERVIVALATAEPVLEVLVIPVVRVGLFGVDVTLQVGLGIGAQRARARRWNALCTAVTCEVALLEDLDESVFTMALDGTGVADACRCPFIGLLGWWGIACQTGEDVLAQRSENVRAGINALEGVRSVQLDADVCARCSYVWEGLACVSFEKLL